MYVSRMQLLKLFNACTCMCVDQGNMSIARTAVGAAAIDGLIYAIGGECAVAASHDETMYLKSTEYYHPNQRVRTNTPNVAL